MSALKFRLASMLGIALACVLADQATKALFRHILSDGVTISLLGGSLVILPSYNRGAFLGLGLALSEEWRSTVFIYGVAAFLTALMIWAIRSPTLRQRDQWAIACIFGGGVSNLLDRIAYHGQVFDFLNIGIGPLRTGIFNLADMAIMTGLGLLLLDSLLPQRRTT